MERFKQRMLQFLAFLQAHSLHHLHDAVGAEQPHQIVLQRNEKMRRAGVALARATAAQLAVNAPRLVALGAEHVQAADFGDARPEFDVRAAAGHVRGDGDGAALAGARDDFGLLLVIFRVEDGVDQSRRVFSIRDSISLASTRDGADQNGRPCACSSLISATTALNFSRRVL